MDRTKISSELETLIDRSSLQCVLTLLAETCQEKSTHIRDNWQDHDLADYWAALGSRIDRIANTCKV
jgi:hypothetical protein